MQIRLFQGLFKMLVKSSQESRRIANKVRGGRVQKQSRSLRQPGFHGSGWLRHCEAKQGSARPDVPCTNGNGSPWQVSPASRGLQMPRWTRPLFSQHTIDSAAVARIPRLSSAAPRGSSVAVCPLKLPAPTQEGLGMDSTPLSFFRILAANTIHRLTKWPQGVFISFSFTYFAHRCPSS